MDDRLQDPTRPLPVLDAPGAVLDDRYRLDRLIGQGGMADVWAGDDLFLDRPVAVKLFRFGTPGFAPDRVDAEMRTIAQLNHPGIVTVYDAGRATDPAAIGDGDPWHGRYLVMELVQGPTLADRLREGPMPEAHAVELAGQVATTLAYLHGRGVVHRDIKPANILLQPPQPADAQPFQARLTDFGIAGLAGAAPTTAPGTTLGTANYLSPEQATGAAVGPATDVYSLGLVLGEVLTGRIAYPGNDLEAVTARLHRAPDIPEGLGQRWTRVLAAMTADDPAQRPPAADLSALFGSWPTAGPGDPESRPPSPYGVVPVTSRIAESRGAPRSPTRVLPAASDGVAAARSGKRRHTKALAAGAALAVVIAAIAVLLLTMSHRGTAPSTPAPSTTVHYPTVSGQIGEHLRQLEDAVG